MKNIHLGLSVLLIALGQSAVHGQDSGMPASFGGSSEPGTNFYGSGIGASDGFKRLFSTNQVDDAKIHTALSAPLHKVKRMEGGISGEGQLWAHACYDDPVVALDDSLPPGVSFDNVFGAKLEIQQGPPIFSFDATESASRLELDAEQNNRLVLSSRAQLYYSGNSGGVWQPFESKRYEFRVKDLKDASFNISLGGFLKK